MKKRTVSKTISLVVAWQMAVSPMALAVGPSAGVAASPTTAPAPTSTSAGWTETFANIMSGVTTVGNSIIQGMQQKASMVAAQNQFNALTAQMNPANCGTSGAQQQCVDEIFPECNILNTRPNLVEPSACTNGIDPTDANASNKAGILMGYYNHFSQIENVYKNFNLETNATSNTGMGCLNAQADKLARTLKQREDEIDNLINKMQKAQDKFKQDAEADRAKIEDAQSLLEGESFKGRKSSLSENSVKFADSFKDSGCLSVLNGDDFNNTGKSKGFKGIESLLSSKANEKVQPGGFSAAEFSTTMASSLEADIRKMATNAAKNIQTFGLDNASADKLKTAVSSTYSLNTSSSFTTAITESLTDAQTAKADVMQQVSSFAGNAESLMSSLQNNKADFEFALNNWEKEQKNECLSNYGNIQALMSNSLKIIDQSNSKSANRYSDNAYKTFIETTLKRTDITIEQKMSLISAKESENNNTRYIVDTQASASIDSTTVDTTTKMSPAKFIQLHIDNCKAKFENNPNSQGYSGRQVVDKLRSARQEIQKIQTNIAGTVQNAIINRMLNCADTTLANATGVATCSSKELSSSSANFCVKRASACATNMRQCLTKAQEQVKTITKNRDVAVAQYKANVKKNEEDLRKMYLQVEQLTSADGLNIAASLKQSLVLPSEDVKFSIDTNDRQYVKGLESLEIQDPDQYFDLMKKNLLSLKTKIHDQNDAVMNGDKKSGLANANSLAQQGVYGHIQNIQKNMNDIMGDIQKYKQLCQQQFQAYMNGMKQARQEAAKASGEAQKNQAEFCGKYNEISTMPGCENEDEFDDILKAAQTAGASGSAEAQETRAWKNFCRSRGDSNTDEINAATYKKLNANTSVDDACEKDENKELPACRKLANYKLNCDVESGTITDAGLKLLSDKVKEACIKDGSFADTYKDGDSTFSCSDAIKKKTNCNINDFNEGLMAYKDQAAKALVSFAGSQSSSDERADFKKYSSSTRLGENKTSSCSAQNNTGGAIGKAVLDAATTISQGVINAGAATQN